MSDTIFTNVESVVPTTSGTVLLGVSLSVQPAAFPVSLVAQPWRWTILGWTILGRPVSGPWTIIDPRHAHIGLPGTDDNTGAWGQVTTAATTALVDAATKIGNGLQGPAPGLSRNIVLTNRSFSENEDVAAAHKYVALLFNMAAAPYPIPQNLQLTFFLEFSPSASFGEFVALPVFSVDGVTYDPSTQPLPVTISPAPVPPPLPSWQATVAGVDMYSEFSKPDASSLVPNSLWLPSVPSVSAVPLVSDWQAHLYELIGPYFDIAHVVINPADPIIDPADHGFAVNLEAALPTTQDWRNFRECIVDSLYNLIHAASPKPSHDQVQWAQTLRTYLGGDFAQLPALNPGDTRNAKKFEDELNDLRKIVNAACTGANLGKLVKNEAPTNVPAKLLDSDNASTLLSFLQSQLAVPQATAIAAACILPTVPAPAPVPQSGLDIIAQTLSSSIVSSNLTLQFSSKPWLQPPVVNAVVAACMTSLGNGLRNELRRRALGTDNPTGAPALTAKAPPLVVPALQARAADDLGDPLRGIRGVGVLMRRRETVTMDWSCLNVVVPVLNPATGPVNAPDCPALVATRLMYDRNLLTGSVLYNNGPLPCANLLHEYMQAPNRLVHVQPDNPNQQLDLSLTLDSVLQYVSYEGIGRLGLRGTPALKAGSSYEAACFVVSNSGALPVSLRDGYPARFKTLFASDVQPPSVIRLQYFRSVPVAGLQTYDEKGNVLTNPAGIFPVIPSNVWPRATETLVPQTGAGLPAPPVAPVLPGAPEPPAPPRPPLLLLTPPSRGLTPVTKSRKRMHFSVKLPSVDAQTWDTTHGHLLPPQTRASILDQVYKRLAANQKVEITDPLINSVDFTVYRWTGTWTKISSILSYKPDVLLSKSPNAIQGVETIPIGISIDAGSGVTAAGTGNDGSITLQAQNALGQATNQTLQTGLAEGEVYLLEAIVLLQNSVSQIMPHYHSAFPGYQLLIELGSASMPTDLLTPFKATPKAVAGIPEQKVEIRLTPGSAPFWNNITRVDFLRQSWSWTGRTQPRIDNDPTLDDNLAPQYYPVNAAPAIVQRWEQIEFAERPAADHVEFTSTFANGSFGFDHDLSLDPRATYLRYAPRVFSRYQGLFQEPSWFVVNTIGNGDGADHWTSCFIHSRAKNLNMPRLKALLPLTESAFTSGCPGILAVFDGPACDQAGLAERLQVSFATVADPDPKVTTRWHQVGPDFLMSSESADPRPENQIYPKLLAIGPIGHTLSAASGLHKFISHSWIVRPDPSDPSSNHDFSWWFANLQFALSIDAPSSVFPGATITSETTTGSWIQFLPGFQDSAHHSSQFADCYLLRKGDMVYLFDSKGGGLQRTRANPHVQQFLLVTRAVLDISGIPRESYVGIARQTGGEAGWKLLGGYSLPDNASLRARFLDVRAGLQSILTTDADFWRTILGDKSNGPDDEHRASPIVLSMVIKQKGV